MKQRLCANINLEIKDTAKIVCHKCVTEKKRNNKHKELQKKKKKKENNFSSAPPQLGGVRPRKNENAKIK